MAYYTALVTAWNAASLATGATLPSGVTGSLLTGLTTANKLNTINAWTVVGPALPANIEVTAIIGAIAPADFLALTALQLQELQFLMQSANTISAPPGGTIRSVFSSIFAGKTTTLANLAALVAPFDTPAIPWSTAPVSNGGGGLFSSIGVPDLTVAGGLV